MGLDAVELVMEFEDAFAIKIPDDVVSRMLTVGDVFEYIVAAKSAQHTSSVCLSAVAFYSLRRAANSLGACARLRPNDRTIEMLKGSKHRNFWAQLQQRTQLKLPPLRRPGWLILLAVLFVIGWSLALGYLAFQSADTELVGIAAAIASGIVLTIFAGLVTKPFAVLPASHCRTLRGLAEATLAGNLQTLSERNNGVNRNDLWVALRSIIVAQLGVSPEAVTPTANFVNDLGM